MTEVGSADLSRLLQSKRNEHNAIVTSRKRKLRELFAVATHVDGLPQDAFANPDAPAPTPAEWKFLQASDILQGKTLNDLNIPPRPRPSLETLKRSLTSSTLSAIDGKPQLSSPGASRGTESPVQDGVSTAESSTATPLDGAVSGRLKSTPVAHGALPVPPQLPVDGRSKSTSTESDAKQPDNEDSAVIDVTHRRTAQVSFPPGTKGSPSEDTAPDSSLDATAGTTKGRTEAANRRKHDGTLLSIKLPSDGSRAPDALSSPGSTAPSATTPAVHDVSTDTSPDNDGPQYVDPADRKPDHDAGDESDEAEADRESRAVDAQSRPKNTAPVSAEDQLLQESMRSSAAMSSPGIEDDGEPSQTSRTGDASRQPVTASAAEIPDSQAGSPDQMDVDGGETAGDAQSQTVLSAREQNLPTQVAPSTPPSIKSAPKENAQVPERAVTRVSSGAMRLKSVTEIVGGTPRPSGTADRALTKSSHDQLTPSTSTPHSPSSRYRSEPSNRRSSKSQVSTVLFGKQPRRVDEKSVVPGQKEPFLPTDDYYTPLFLQGFTGSSTWMQPLEKILFHANKTVATPDAHLAIQDYQACKVLRRVYHLQQHDKWSLRQPKRWPEPTRPVSQWDVTLQEMKWMRTDFREERKWKTAVARNLAYACAEWHEASPERRKAMQVNASIPSKAQPTDDVAMADADGEVAENQSTPELVPSADVDSPQNVDELAEFVETVAPSAIFTLQEDDVVFGLRRTPTADQLLDELPMYGTPLKIPEFDITGSDYDPDALWRRPALPLSKYVEGQMKLVSQSPPRKRSRYTYRNEDSDDETDSAFTADKLTHKASLPPTTEEVALFNPDLKHIRDRLHAGHQFRPPSEHPMPLQSFYECRSASQWTLSEDDELRNLVREYSYNWPLISSMLTSKSLFTSGAERRTPWECFERWINLEGLPADMQKTQYFKAYNTRIEAAQRVIAQHNQLAAQQANASGGAITPLRRRPSTPLRVERRRNQKHLTLIDAMRKLAKKRETTMQKQQHNANQSAANKKPNEAPSQRPTKTPRDYSLLRWERDQALAEKMAQYAQRQEAQRRAAIQARAQGQAGQMAATPGAAQAGQNQAAGANGVKGVPRVNMTSAQMAAAAAAAAAAGQGRPRMPMQAPANGVAGAAPAAHMNGGLVAPQMNGQAQMQGVQAQQRMPMPNQQQADANLMLRAQRISEQQRAAVQMQQAQQVQQQGGAGTPGQQGSPPAMRNGVNGVAMNQQSFMTNAQALMASFNAGAANGGHSVSPPTNGLQHPPAGSPPAAQARALPQLPASITAQLNQLEAQFRTKNPSLTPEQARHLATEHLTRAMMAQRQNAMNAAAGAAAGQAGLANGIAATTSPHQYAALLRQQQQQQQQQAQLQLQQQQANPAAAAAGSPAQQQLALQRQSSEGSTPNVAK